MKLFDVYFKYVDEKYSFMIDDKLLKGIIAYALDDWLRFKLGKKLIGVDELEDDYDHFIDAVSYLSRRPTVRKILASLTNEEMQKLLIALEEKLHE